MSWSSKRQTTVSRSSAEAEYWVVAHVVAECCWLRQLLQELHVSLKVAIVVYCDNVSAVYMTANPSTTAVPSTLRSTSTSFARRWLSAKFVFFMCCHNISSLIS